MILQGYEKNQKGKNQRNELFYIIGKMLEHDIEHKHKMQL